MGTHRILHASAIGAAVLLAGSILAPSAWADIISFDLTSGNTPNGLGQFPGPYASVTVNLTDSTHATITFDSLFATGGACGVTGCTYVFAGQGAVAVNVNATSWTLGTVTGTQVGLTGFNSAGPYSSGGAGNEDGFGSFNQTIDSFDGFQHSATEVSFTLTDTSGTWASASNVLIGNDSGNRAAMHGFACSGLGACVESNGVLATGYASTPGPVLGAGLPGVVMACTGLLALARRRRQKIV